MNFYDWCVFFQGAVIRIYSGYTFSGVLEKIYDLGFSPADICSGAVELHLIPSDD